MIALSLIHGWMNLLGSLAIVATVLAALGLMLGIVKPADAIQLIATIVCIVVALTLLSGILASAWSAMSWWQQVALAAIEIILLAFLCPRRRTRMRKKP